MFERNFKEEFLFCMPLWLGVCYKLLTTSLRNDLNSENVVGVTSDNAPAMFCSRSGFQALVKQCVPKATELNCFIYGEALLSKTLPAHLNTFGKNW